MGREGRLALGHLGLAVLRGDLLKQRPLSDVTRDDRNAVLFSTFHHLLEAGHHVTALGLGRLMASLAVGLKNRPNVVIETDRPARRAVGYRRRGRLGKERKKLGAEPGKNRTGHWQRENRGNFHRGEEI